MKESFTDVTIEVVVDRDSAAFGIRFDEHGCFVGTSQHIKDESSEDGMSRPTEDEITEAKKYAMEKLRRFIL